jgi:glycosyltransferase involved in cell wall biosynthesis
LHTLLAALPALPHEAWRLDIIGSDRPDPAYAQRCRTQAVPFKEQVRFWGELADDQLDQLLRQSHVLVTPSSYEGFGIVYLEGMSFGLPAIATCQGAAGEMITDGVNGFLVNAGDVAALAGHLRRLIDDRPFLVAMSLAARNRFLEFPTWEQSMANIRTFLINTVKS